jgi:hypothetical protein
MVEEDQTLYAVSLNRWGGYIRARVSVIAVIHLSRLSHIYYPAGFVHPHLHCRSLGISVNRYRSTRRLYILICLSNDQIEA